MGDDLQTQQPPWRPLERSLPQNDHPLAPQSHPHSGPHGDLLQDKQVPIPRQADTDRTRKNMDAHPEEVQRSQTYHY